MHTPPRRRMAIRRRRLGRVAMAVLVPLLLVAGAAAVVHVRLEASTPGPDETLAEPPSQLRLRFSGRIEQRYTAVELRAPDGSVVPTGAVEFVAGSDREFTAALPPIRTPGEYTVRWRTAGADGHVLQGSYAFVLTADTAAAAPDPTRPAEGEPGAELLHHHEHGEPETVRTAAGAAPVLGRWLHFTALLLLIGAVAARTLLLPRLTITEVTASALRRRIWRVTALAALLLAAAAVLRLWLQSRALHGVDRAWDSRLLSIMLTDTTWGRAWLVQAFFFALLGAGLAAARPHRDRYALFLALPAAIGLAAVPALSGHAAGATGGAALAVANDTLHVLAASAWLGLLAVLLTVVLPVLRRHEAAVDAARAHAVHRFSPIALLAAGTVAGTGVINSLLHLSRVDQLWETSYGAALLAKLAVLSLVVLSGFYNWRVIRPRLADAAHARRFRASAGFEVAVAAVVLLATAILTGLPRP